MISLLAPNFRRRVVRMVCALGVASTTLSPACADEGIWTFDSPPTRALQSGYGFTPGAEWLDALRLSAVRVNPNDRKTRERA
jgi:hypothetical protein